MHDFHVLHYKQKKSFWFQTRHLIFKSNASTIQDIVLYWYMTSTRMRYSENQAKRIKSSADRNCLKQILYSGNRGLVISNLSCTSRWWFQRFPTKVRKRPVGIKTEYECHYWCWNWLGGEKDPNHAWHQGNHDFDLSAKDESKQKGSNYSSSDGAVGEDRVIG